MFIAMAPSTDLSLTHGQVAWALARGQQPTAVLIDRIDVSRLVKSCAIPPVSWLAVSSFWADGADPRFTALQ
jgi:hypothetical protein